MSWPPAGNCWPTAGTPPSGRGRTGGPVGRSSRSKKGMQVHLPVVGERSRCVSCHGSRGVPAGGRTTSSTPTGSPKRYWFKQLEPVFRFVEASLRRRGLLISWTTRLQARISCGANLLGTRAAAELEDIGYLEPDLIQACRYTDAGDIKRRWGVSLEAARVFSGLGKLAEYLALLTLEAFKDNEAKGALPMTVFGQHRPVHQLRQLLGRGIAVHEIDPEPLQPAQEEPRQVPHVPAAALGGRRRRLLRRKAVVEETDLDRIVECMWDLERAAGHAERLFPGLIPCGPAPQRT